jgi:hypothetical protein
MGRLAALPLVCTALWPAFCQTPSQPEGPYRIELGLERKVAGQWRPIDPGLVLQKGDRVRFRFRANFDGYLYVMNQGSSGNFALLFPADETGRQNQVENGKEYLVPATKGSFRIAGPAGHDITYWVISPFDLRTAGGSTQPHYNALPPPPSATQPAPPLIPRCDDNLFRARGDCVDVSAGARKLGGQLPSNLAGAASPAARDLRFDRDRKLSVISTPVALTGPVMYEFHLAHR